MRGYKPDPIGTVLEVSEIEGKALIEKGSAELVVKEEKKPAKTKEDKKQNKTK